MIAEVRGRARRGRLELQPDKTQTLHNNPRRQPREQPEHVGTRDLFAEAQRNYCLQSSGYIVCPVAAYVQRAFPNYPFGACVGEMPD